MMIAIPSGAGGTPNAQQPDPDELDPSSGFYFPAGNLERVVYFTNASNYNTVPGGARNILPSSAAASVPVSPGGYAVVGSGEQPSNRITGVADATRTYVGFCVGASSGGPTVPILTSA